MNSEPPSNTSAASREFQQAVDAQTCAEIVAGIPAIILRNPCEPHPHALFVSDGVSQICGYLPSHFVGEHGHDWRELVHPQDLTTYDAVTRAAAESVTPFTVEYRIVHSDGSIHWLHQVGWPTGSPDGSTRVLDGIIMDVTLRKNAEEALKEVERFQLAAIEAAGEMIVIANAHGRVLYVNPAFVKISGYADHEVIGKSSEQLGAVQSAAALDIPVLAIVRNGQTWSGTTWRRHKDGTRYPHEMIVTPVRDWRGQVTWCVSVGRDISGRMRATALQREREDLRKAMESMERILGVVGHELRTPLAGIRAMSDHLLSTAGEAIPEQDQFLRRINQEAVRMAEIVNNMLEVARLNSGTAKWNWCEFPVVPVCTEAVDTIRPLIATDAVTLSIEAPDTSWTMHGDPGAIRRLLVNLLNNSRQHTTTGRIVVRAAPATKDGHEWTIIRVADTGTGIDPDIAGKLGEAFVLNAGVVGDQYVSGSGLGLSICRGIVAAHGGSIEVRSARRHGTCITARLRSDLVAPIAGEAQTQLIRSIVR